MKIITKIIDDGRFWLIIKWESFEEFPAAKTVIDWLVEEIGKENYDRGPSGGYFGFLPIYGNGSGFDTFILSLEDGMGFKLRWL